MSKRLKMLGAAAIAAATMAASAQAATVFDLTERFASPGRSPLIHAINTGFPVTGMPEPATMIVLGTILLMAFRGQRQA